MLNNPEKIAEQISKDACLAGLPPDGPVDPVPGHSDAALPSDHLSHPGASHPEVKKEGVQAV